MPLPKAWLSDYATSRFTRFFVLSFIGSVCAPDKATLKAENHALQCTNAGPYHAILSDLLGVGISPAARYRVAACSTTLSRDLDKISTARGHNCTLFCSFSHWEKEFLVSSVAFSTANAFGETPAAPPDRAAGARTRQHENSKRAHFRAPALQKPHQNSTKGPPRERRKKENCGGRVKKSAKFWAPHPSGPHPSGPNPSWPPPSGPHPSVPHPWVPHPSGPHPSGPHLSMFGPPALRGPCKNLIVKSKEYRGSIVISCDDVFALFKTHELSTLFKAESTCASLMHLEPCTIRA